MATWYHGTNEKRAYKSILKNGFDQYTYFTPYLDTALGYGGKYVFAVYFEKDPSTYWEWRCPEVIAPEKILYVKKYFFRVLHFNKFLAEMSHHSSLLEQNPGKSICPECNGSGELRKKKYKYRSIFEIGGGAFKTRKDPCIICENCNGNGVIGA
jgi:hypothetical protein